MERTGLGACIGTAIGFLGWLVGFAAVCAATGELGVLRQVALPGLALSLGAAGIVIVTSEVASRALGRGRAFQLALWGEVLFLVGILFLLLNHWVAPLVDAAPDLRAAIVRLGRVYRTGDGFPAALMATGTVLLGCALVHIRRRA